MIWHENFVPVFRSVKKMLGEGGRGGVVKVESRKWEVGIRNPIFALQKSTFDFDFLSWKLTFWSDFLVRKSTFDFWVWLFTLQINFWFCVSDFWWPLSAAVIFGFVSAKSMRLCTGRRTCQKIMVRYFALFTLVNNLCTCYWIFLLKFAPCNYYRERLLLQKWHLSGNVMVACMNLDHLFQVQLYYL